MRAVRHGPLLPARLYWCDHEPGVPENKLDRGRLSIFPRADVGGVEVDPEHLADRLYSMTDPTPAHQPSHWRYAKPISEGEYKWRLDSLRWAEQHQPDHPTLRPRRLAGAAEMPVPDFNREKELLD